MIGEGARTFIRIMVVSFVLAAAVLAGVLLFVRSYEEHQRQGAVTAIRTRLAEADRLVAAGDLEGAAGRYQQVLVAAPTTYEGRVARTSLATVLNRMALRAAQLGRTDHAVSLFRSVLGMYAQYPDYLTANDRQELIGAEENLSALSSASAPDRTSRPDANAPVSQDPGASVSAPSIGEARAREFLAAGNRAYSDGNLDEARAHWTAAVGAAPGTTTSRQAQAYLDSTTPPPAF